MKKIGLLIAFAFSLTVCFAQQISLEDITSGKYAPKRVQGFVSSGDGEHYFLVNENKSMIIKYSYKTATVVDTIFNTAKARECDFTSFEGFLISPDEKRLLVYRDSEQIYRHSFKANYYYYDVRRNLVRKLTENPGKQMVPVFSKDGRMLAYVSDNNIWLAKFDYDTESQVTKDGKTGSIINGATDWLYEEEFGVTSMIDFSDDNKLLAFLRFDETDVKEFSFQFFDHQLYPTLKTFKYPKAGETNSTVTCQVFDIEARTIRQMDIPSAGTEYIPRIQFVNDSQLAVMTLNREQNDFNMYMVNPRSSVSRLVLNEKNERYIDPALIPSIHFFNDEFIYLSERSGYSHIYSYTGSGVMQKQLTSGDYDVTRILAVDPNKKTVFFESAEESPLRRSVYKADITKGNKTKLSSKQGYNIAVFGKTGIYYVNEWSDVSTPPIFSIHDANGKELKVIEDNGLLKNNLPSLHLSNKEFVNISTKSGQTLNGWIKKPADMDAGRRYPLVMVQYSGPGSQEVKDRFNIDWIDYLVTQGFVVACVDGRGTGARGEEFKKCTYLNLGILESDDQLDAAAHFASLPYVDPSRIGIWGWSYGGQMVLMTMSRGTVFKAGVAIAPVTDWRFYDTAYTERYMRTLQQNAAGYERASLVSLANKLSGKLLLIHGSADDNVHYQNSMEYVSALIKADKHADMFVFPDLNHSILGNHNRKYLYTKIVDYFKANL